MTGLWRRGVFVVFAVTTAACGWFGNADPYLGEWSVSSVASPGASGSNGGLVGVRASYAAEQAQFGQETCTGPSYSRRWIAAAAFADAYDVRPEHLGLPTRGEIGMVDVTCGGGSLGPGSTLILKSDDAMLTAWDGAYYELERQ